MVSAISLLDVERVRSVVSDLHFDRKLAMKGRLFGVA
jgi:hypothetical protein